LSGYAELKSKEKNYSQAIKYANEVIAIGKKANLEGLTDGAYEVLVGAYKGLGQYDDALVAHENYWKIKQKFLEVNRNKSVSKLSNSFNSIKKRKRSNSSRQKSIYLKKNNLSVTL
jgi:tetratricopeptide (TPR) repeat protein